MHVRFYPLIHQRLDSCQYQVHCLGQSCLFPYASCYIYSLISSDSLHNHSYIQRIFIYQIREIKDLTLFGIAENKRFVNIWTITELLHFQKDVYIPNMLLWGSTISLYQQDLSYTNVSNIYHMLTKAKFINPKI